MTQNVIKAYFALAIQFIPAKELGALFANLGYNKPVTAQLCITALDENGKDFSVPFGKLAVQALSKPDARAFIRASAEQFAQFNGKKINYFDKDKADAAVNIIDTVGGVLVGGVGSTAQLIQATKSSGVTQQDVDLQNAKNESMRVSIDENKWWIIGGVGVLAVLAIVVVILITRKHK